LEDTEYHFYIDDGTPEGQDRWENVMELRRLASEYQEQGLHHSWNKSRWFLTRIPWM